MREHRAVLYEVNGCATQTQLCACLEHISVAFANQYGLHTCLNVVSIFHGKGLFHAVVNSHCRHSFEILKEIHSSVWDSILCHEMLVDHVLILQQTWLLNPDSQPPLDYFYIISFQYPIMHTMIKQHHTSINRLTAKHLIQWLKIMYRVKVFIQQFSRLTLSLTFLKMWCSFSY